MFDATDFEAGPHPIERRRASRARSLLLGKVLFVTNSLTSDCLVRNLSALGARITLKDAGRYPSESILVVVKTGVAHETETVWAGPDERGLRFANSHHLAGDTSPRFSHAYRLWIENLPR